MLDVALALNRMANVFVEFRQDEPSQSVSLGEALDQALAVRENAPTNVGGDARIQRPVPPIRHDIDPAAAHERKLSYMRISAKTWVAGTSPAMSGYWAFEPGHHRDWLGNSAIISPMHGAFAVNLDGQRRSARASRHGLGSPDPNRPCSRLRRSPCGV